MYKQTHSAAHSPLLIVMLILATAMGPLAMSSFIPAIPAIQQAFSVDTAVAQLTMSISMVAMAVFSLIYGALADRYGRRPVLLLGVAIAAIGSLASAFAPTIEWVIAGRALQAAGATSGLILTRVIVHDIYGDGRTASVLGYITVAMTLAPLLGPIFGGLLIETVGWQAVFVAVSILASGLFIVLSFKLPETKHATDKPASPLINHLALRELLTNPVLRRTLLFAALGQSTFMAFLAGAPHVIVSHFQLPASHYGLYFAVIPLGFAAGGFIAGRFSERIGYRLLMVVGAWGAVSSTLLALLLINSPLAQTPWVLFLPAAFVAFFHSVSAPGAQAEILSQAGLHAGVASGLSSFSQLVLGAVTAQTVGELVDHGPLMVMLVMAATSAAALFVLLRGFIDKQPSPQLKPL